MIAEWSTIQAWYCILAISALVKLRHEDCQFKANLDYITRLKEKLSN
jgi:hypothetical protein